MLNEKLIVCKGFVDRLVSPEVQDSKKKRTFMFFNFFLRLKVSRGVFKPRLMLARFFNNDEQEELFFRQKKSYERNCT